MSLTSYRAAPPRGNGCHLPGTETRHPDSNVCLLRPRAWKTWQRPTLPRLETQYHWRRGFSRPSSEWDRVQAPRNNHQVVQTRGNANAIINMRIVPMTAAGTYPCARRLTSDQAKRAISTG